MGRGEDDAGEDGSPKGGASPGGDAGEGGKKDIETEIRQILAKARGRLDGVRSVQEENATRLKTLQKGFKDLKRQQNHVTREQQQALGQLQGGLHG
uniref:Uncharacterized protein n=1 Tax=Zooxanthella nutricula TaxID=1333877 RepID=A0A7S2QC78_9DINO